MDRNGIIFKINVDLVTSFWIRITGSAQFFKSLFKTNRISTYIEIDT